MKSLPKFLAATCAAASLGIAFAAEAHGIWFAQRGTQLALIYGVGADDLDAVKRLPLIKSVEGFDETWAPVAASLRAAGIVPVVESEEPITAVAATMDNGIWSKTADGRWHAKGRDQVPDAIIAERTMKFSVHLIKPLTAPVPVIPSQLLQVVPVGAGIPTEMGKPMAVRVLYRGQPVAGAVVINDFINDPDQPPQTTGADGVVSITVRNQGLNVVSAKYVGPTDDSVKYTRIEYLANLSFVLAHAPE